MSKKPDTIQLDIPLEIVKLRQRWELASVLNFLSIFEQVIDDDDLNLSAEEIETALIDPNASLSKLHVTLLKGIPPVNKKLSSPNVWVTVLCKKLAEWWPWVAEGSLPLTAAKGEEISRYKELDPITRLQMLKALCEVRLEQNDMLDYVNDAQKEGRVSSFRKDKIAEDGTGVSYWYDGNSVIGHRLYKEVIKSHSKSRHKGKGCSNLPPDIEWETLATNLNEFHKVLEQLSSRKAGVEAVVYKFIETEVIPVLEQLQKKKERVLKRQHRQDALLNGYQPYVAGVTRSCRNRKPVSYTFDEFDRTIDEALKISRNRKDTKVKRSNGERHDPRKRQKCNSDGDSEKDDQSRDGSPASVDEDMGNEHDGEGSDSDEDTQNDKEGEGSDNDEDVENEQENEGSDNNEDVENEQEGEGSDDNEDVENEQEGENSDSDEDVENEQEGEGSDNDEKLESEQECEGSDNNEKLESEQEREGSDSDEDVNSSENAAENEDGKNNSSENIVENSSDVESENDKRGRRNRVKLRSETNGRGGRCVQTKNRLRQRPSRNTAIKSCVVPDSEDDSSSENPSPSMSGSGDPSEVADSESDGSS